MQTAGNFDGSQVISVRLEYAAQLRNSFAIGPPRQPDKKSPDHTHYVAAIQRRGLAKVFELAIAGERWSQTISCGPPAGGSHHADDRNFVDNDYRIFHEYAIREIRFG